MDFPIWTFLKLLCIVTPARVVLDHGVLVHGGARARAPARARASRPQLCIAFLCTVARARARAPARVVPNHGARRLY